MKAKSAESGTAVSLSRNVAQILRATRFVCDQALLSLVTFLFLIASANRMSPQDFALTSLLLGVQSAITVFYRLAVLDPSMVPSIKGPKVRLPTLSLTLVGIPIGTVAAFFVWLFGAPLAAVTIIASVPVLCALDAARYDQFARGASGRAFVCDSSWLLLSLTAIGFFSQWRTPALTLAVYALGALLALICHLVAGAHVSPAHISSEIRADLFAPARKIWVEYAMTTGSGQLVQWASALILGLSGVAGIRGAMALMGPMGVVFSGMNIVYLSQRRLRGRPLALMVFSVQICSAIFFGVAMLLALHAPTQTLLGHVAVDIAHVWPAYMLVGVTSAIAAGPLTAMRFERRFGRIARYRSLESATNASLAVGLCSTFGPVTIPFVQATADIVTATLAWRFVRSNAKTRHLRPTANETVIRIGGIDAAGGTLNTALPRRGNNRRPKGDEPTRIER